MLARRSIRVLGVRQTLLKYAASALIPELPGDFAARVDEYISYVPARILVEGFDEVPGVTRIGLSVSGPE